MIWRIEKFNVVKWPKTNYGTFYDKDSYIVLYTKKDEKELKHEIFFWLGENTAIDERGVAAYKTVELDDLLEGEPVQYREVQGLESKKFLDVFGGHVTVHKGGMESGFNHHEPHAYSPKLLHIKGRAMDGIRVTEVKREANSLNLGDPFILDAGLNVYAWIPNGANKNEKYFTSVEAQKIQESRKDAQITTLGEEGNDDFWKILGGKPEKIHSDKEGGDDTKLDTKLYLYVYNKDSEDLFDEVEVGDTLSLKNLKEDGLYFVDVTPILYCWVGTKMGKDLTTKLYYDIVDQYILKNNYAVRKVLQGKETPEFKKHFK